MKQNFQLHYFYGENENAPALEFSRITVIDLAKDVKNTIEALLKSVIYDEH